MAETLDAAADVGALFAPFAIKGLNLPNRIVMAPMTRSKSPGGVPGPDVAAYYRRRAEGEVGLIITEGTAPDHRDVARNDPDVPRFFGADALAGWSNVVRETHAGGGRIAPQLWHVGMLRRADKMWNPEEPSAGPSGMHKPGKPSSDPMTEEDIADAVSAFAKAAGEARALGFDALELHGAHGYLIDQFFWDGSNIRDDAWGGDAATRTRFASEIVKAVRAAVGPDFVVILRFSQWKQQDYAARLAQTPEDLARFLAPLTDAGVDVFHCSTRRFWEPEFEGSNLNLAGWVKKLSAKPTITVGSVGLTTDFITGMWEARSSASLDDLVRRLEAEEFDLVAVGRALIANPDWARRVRLGETETLRDYTPDLAQTLY